MPSQDGTEWIIEFGVSNYLYVIVCGSRVFSNPVTNWVFFSANMMNFSADRAACNL